MARRPTVVGLMQKGPWTIGGLANHVWTIDGNDINSTFIQPFINYTTATAWTFGFNTESSYNWNTEEWAVPINATIALFTSATLLLAACGPTVSDDAKMQLAKDVNCSTAQQDVATLENNRVSTGAQYVVPAAAAVNIFRAYNQDGTAEEFYNDREKVVTGEYNKSVDAKIEEIQRLCGLPGA